MASSRKKSPATEGVGGRTEEDTHWAVGVKDDRSAALRVVNPVPDLTEARRLFDAGMKLCRLEPDSKIPVGKGWNVNPTPTFDESASGYGVILHQNGLCSLDPDNLEPARAGMAELGFSLDALLAAGVRTLSTRSGSGGRSVFRAPEGAGWVTFKEAKTKDNPGALGTILELRAGSKNLQDVIPGLIYVDTTTGEICTQRYADPKGLRLDAAPELPEEFREWWLRMSTDPEFRQQQQRRFYAALGIEKTGAVSLNSRKPGEVVPLAFPSATHRTPFNGSHSVEEILERNGYFPVDIEHDRWTYHGATGSPGIRPIPNKNRELWQCDHGGSPLLGTFDAWTAYVALEHSGDVEAAESAFMGEPGTQFALLQKMDAESFNDEWLPALLKITDPVEYDHAKTYVHQRAKIGKRTIEAAVCQAREAPKRKAARAARQADRRVPVRLKRPHSTTVAFAEEIEALLLEDGAARFEMYLQGGLHVRPHVDKLPGAHAVDDPAGMVPEVPLLVPYTRTAMQAQIESAVRLEEKNAKGELEAVAVPTDLPKTILALPVPQAPAVSGLLPHPVVLADGTIVNKPGLHAGSGLLLPPGCEIDGVRPYTQPQAKRALKELRGWFLDGFEPATEEDANQAMGFLLMAVQRKAMAIAPMIAITAPVQSTGKTTLARRVHGVLTGRDMPVYAHAAGDNTEIRKALLATLIASPPMVCYDNIMDGSIFGSPVMNAALTSSTFRDRYLGKSQEIEVGTNTVFVVTGNNIALDADTATRTLEIRLVAKSATPHTRKFEVHDIIADARAHREWALRHVLGIVAGFIENGAEPSKDAIGSRFPHWNRMTREPLLWAGGLDLAEQFSLNIAAAGDAEALGVLLQLLRKHLPPKGFRTADVARAARAAHAAPHGIHCTEDEWRDAHGALIEALGNLRVRDATATASVGAGFRKIRDRVHPETGLVLRKRKTRDEVLGTFWYVDQVKE